MGAESRGVADGGEPVALGLELRDQPVEGGDGLRAVAAGVRSADPGATIVLAGLTNRSWLALRQLYKFGARGLFDVVALHPYTRRAEDVLKLVRFARRVMAKHGDGRLPVWITELSWPAAQGRARLLWGLRGLKARPDLVILELGANDMLRGLPPEQTEANLDRILAELKRRRIPVLLAGMRAAPNMGAAYRARFEGLYPRLARKHGVAFYPFFLDEGVGVGGGRRGS